MPDPGVGFYLVWGRAEGIMGPSRSARKGIAVCQPQGRAREQRLVRRGDPCRAERPSSVSSLAYRRHKRRRWRARYVPAIRPPVLALRRRLAPRDQAPARRIGAATFFAAARATSGSTEM
jgi:hypothetical protein